MASGFYEIKQGCRERFLETNEIFTFLHSVKEHFVEYSNMFPNEFVTTDFSAVSRPEPGTFFVLESSNFKMFRKLDQYTYQTKSTQKKLDLNGKTVIGGYYTQGDGKTSTKDAENLVTPLSLSRRAYRLIQFPKHILVHYFDTAAQGMP